MTAIFTVWLLVLLPIGQPKLEAATKDGSTHQQAQHTSTSMGAVVAQDNKQPPNSNAAAANHQQGGAGATARPAAPSPCIVDYLWGRFWGLKAADKIAFLLLIVTTCYLIATVQIWRAMATSNELAKTAYKEGKDAADADRKLMQGQLNEMQATANATYAIAEFASISSGAIVGQLEAMNTQAGIMLTQAQTAIISAQAAKDAATATADLVQVTQRAWIAVEVKLDDGLLGGVEFYGDDYLRVSIQCNIENIGHAVANKVQLRSKLMFLMANESNPTDRVSRIQSELADRPLDEQSGITLFPAEPGVLTDWPSAIRADFEGAFHDPDEGSTMPRIVPVVVGCVVYEYPNSPIHHATRFAYHVYHKTRRIPPPPPYQPGIDVGVSLRDLNDIGFYKYSGGGGAD